MSGSGYGTLRAVHLSMMSHQPRRPSDKLTFDAADETWFEEPRPVLRPSQRPTAPPPACVANIDDSIADGWFLDI